MTVLTCDFSFELLQKRLENQPLFCFEGVLTEAEEAALRAIVDGWSEADFVPIREALLVNYDLDAPVEFVRKLLKEDLFLAYQNAIDGFDQELIKQILLDDVLHQVGVTDLIFSISPFEAKNVLNTVKSKIFN